MKFEPWALEIFHPALIFWNLGVCVLATLFILRGHLDSFPSIVRIGVSFILIGMLAYVILAFYRLDSDLFPYWALKDLGIGLLVLCYLNPNRPHK